MKPTPFQFLPLKPDYKLLHKLRIEYKNASRDRLLTIIDTMAREGPTLALDLEDQRELQDKIAKLKSDIEMQKAFRESDNRTIEQLEKERTTLLKVLDKFTELL